MLTKNVPIRGTIVKLKRLEKFYLKCGVHADPIQPYDTISIV